jgi:hypothetical protein
VDSAVHPRTGGQVLMDRLFCVPVAKPSDGH